MHVVLPLELGALTADERHVQKAPFNGKGRVEELLKTDRVRDFPVLPLTEDDYAIGGTDLDVILTLLQLPFDKVGQIVVPAIVALAPAELLCLDDNIVVLVRRAHDVVHPELVMCPVDDCTVRYLLDGFDPGSREKGLQEDQQILLALPEDPVEDAVIHR